ncbi:MAG: carboxypeptidase-like regulatory domain-containing protein [Anaerolineae bacterium]
MPLEDSPSLEEYRQGLPPLSEETRGLEKPPRRTGRLGWWLVIAALAVVALALAVWNVLQMGNVPNSEAGFGEVVGRVVDAAGNPVRAEILVDVGDIRIQADADGRFRLTNVPAGRRALLIGYMYMAREHFVTVRANTTLDLGEIVMPSSVREGGYGRLEWR